MTFREYELTRTRIASAATSGARSIAPCAPPATSDPPRQIPWTVPVAPEFYMSAVASLAMLCNVHRLTGAQALCSTSSTCQLPRPTRRHTGSMNQSGVWPSQPRSRDLPRARHIGRGTTERSWQTPGMASLWHRSSSCTVRAGDNLQPERCIESVKCER